MRIEAARRPDDPAIARWRDQLAAAEDDDLASVLADTRADLERLRSDLAELLEDVDDLPLGELVATLDAVAEPRQASVLRAVGPSLRALAEHPEAARALRRLPAMPAELEYAVCAATLEEAEATRPSVARFGGDRLAELVARGQALLPELYAADAAVIVARLRTRFRDDVAFAQRSVTGMTPAERERKKLWTTGRRELENEFRKVMRYRSIRDLASGETGAVVAALRPIWLMSPTSVSDTLPLARELFDVVIYDEASQIPVEEAVPAMHRADQVIVVGDRMQLPPTRFFTASSTLADDPDDEVEVGVVLDGDSFLAQSAGRLPSTMLTWHYRSRYESLIDFSNAAFYDGRLATIPDRRPGAEALPEIRVAGSDVTVAVEDEALAGVDALLERPVSVHRLEGSPYVQRTNPGEAAYIARLVRELLRRETGLTIGIVAFSEAQQSEIERQLEALAHADTAFAARYEAELIREDDDQVVGLFVKNLENVQGDERDIILMSVCYGPDRDGRMAMNFGPINQEGGEKRLNVIFSRARVHMAIVASIDGSMITNTYNDGANTLRRFLEYAAALSRGDPNGALAVITSFRDRRAVDVAAVRRDAVTTHLAEALRARGLLVTERVGRSGFRVDLAVRRPDDEEYRVAVLVDSAARVRSQPVPERVLAHPGVLRATGWQVVHVLTRDWHERPDAVIEAVERAMTGDDGRDAAIGDAVRDELTRATAELELVTPGVTRPNPILAGPVAGTVPGRSVATQPGADRESLNGRSVCFTGTSVCSIGGVRMSREDQERLAREHGMDVRQSVTSRLDYLVVSHAESQSAKAQRAAQLGIRRLDEAELWERLGVAVEVSTRTPRPERVAAGSPAAAPSLAVVQRPSEGVLWTIQVPGSAVQRIFPGGEADVVHVSDGDGVMFPHLAFRTFALSDGRHTGTVKTGTPIRAVVHLADGDLLAASDSRLHRLSPVTLLERGRWETRIPRYTETMAVEGGHVAVANWLGPTIGFVDLGDGKVRRRTAGDHPRLVQDGARAFALGAATGEVWAVDVADARVTEAFTAFRAIAVVAAFGILWLLEGRPDKPKASKRLLRFDLATGQDVGGAELAVAVERLVTGRLGVWGISDDHLVWIAGPDGERAGRVWRAAVGEQWLAVDPDRGIAFAAHGSTFGRGRATTDVTARGLGV
jgi:hypothetical protein